MFSVFHKKARVYTLLSLVFVAQCCCCIIPVGWQVWETSPSVQRILELFQAGIMALR